MYFPEALQYVHAILYGGGAWTVAPRAPVTAQIAALRGTAAADLSGL